MGYGLDYVARNQDGDVLHKYDLIKDFRGDVWQYLGISRPPQPGKDAKVLARPEHDTAGSQEFYARVFYIDVDSKA